MGCGTHSKMLDILNSDGESIFLCAQHQLSLANVPSNQLILYDLLYPEVAQLF